jgi:hypothetical protein
MVEIQIAADAPPQPASITGEDPAFRDGRPIDDHLVGEPSLVVHRGNDMDVI